MKLLNYDTPVHTLLVPLLIILVSECLGVLVGRICAPMILTNFNSSLFL
jgi:hypothetical protein